MPPHSANQFRKRTRTAEKRIQVTMIKQKERRLRDGSLAGRRSARPKEKSPETNLDLLLELGLPGLVFLGLSVWLIRKLMKAARTERDLEEERLQGAFADELRAAKARAAASQHPSLMAVAAPEPAPALPDPLAAANTHTANEYNEIVGPHPLKLSSPYVAAPTNAARVRMT